MDDLDHYNKIVLNSDIFLISDLYTIMLAFSENLQATYTSSMFLLSDLHSGFTSSQHFHSSLLLCLHRQAAKLNNLYDERSLDFPEYRCPAN